MAAEIEESARNGSLALLPPAGALVSDPYHEVQSFEGAGPSTEWALAFEMVRCAGASYRARTAAAYEVVSHVQRWAQQRLREVEHAQRLVSEAQARAIEAEGLIAQAEARARRAEQGLRASEAKRRAAEERADEACQSMRYLFERVRSEVER